ncbi:iq calmodulin-binding motif family [Cystoisospora suis]|uniref:Iq calmodulin-binding motif family n=1 Tax=Cystoisospora suis TaxID=483139 RepID=A0A2C6KH06_9APIC|nr:iq calmodulin-binding motif family [Cystoisospora suis]
MPETSSSSSSLRSRHLGLLSHRRKAFTSLLDDEDEEEEQENVSTDSPGRRLTDVLSEKHPRFTSSRDRKTDDYNRRRDSSLSVTETRQEEREGGEKREEEEERGKDFIFLPSSATQQPHTKRQLRHRRHSPPSLSSSSSSRPVLGTSQDSSSASSSLLPYVSSRRIVQKQISTSSSSSSSLLREKQVLQRHMQRERGRERLRQKSKKSHAPVNPSPLLISSSSSSSSSRSPPSRAARTHQVAREKKETNRLVVYPSHRQNRGRPPSSAYVSTRPSFFSLLDSLSSSSSSDSKRSKTQPPSNISSLCRERTHTTSSTGGSRRRGDDSSPGEREASDSPSHPSIFFSSLRRGRAGEEEEKTGGEEEQPERRGRRSHSFLSSRQRLSNLSKRLSGLPTADVEKRRSFSSSSLQFSTSDHPLHHNTIAQEGRRRREPPLMLPSFSDTNRELSHSGVSTLQQDHRTLLSSFSHGGEESVNKERDDEQGRSALSSLSPSPSRYFDSLSRRKEGKNPAIFTVLSEGRGGKTEECEDSPKKNSSPSLLSSFRKASFSSSASSSPRPLAPLPSSEKKRIASTSFPVSIFSSSSFSNSKGAVCVASQENPALHSHHRSTASLPSSLLLRSQTQGGNPNDTGPRRTSASSSSFSSSSLRDLSGGGTGKIKVPTDASTESTSVSDTHTKTEDLYERIYRPLLSLHPSPKKDFHSDRTSSFASSLLSCPSRCRAPSESTARGEEKTVKMAGGSENSSVLIPGSGSMSDEALELRVKTLEDKVSHIKFSTQTRVKLQEQELQKLQDGLAALKMRRDLPSVSPGILSNCSMVERIIKDEIQANEHARLTFVAQAGNDIDNLLHAVKDSYKKFSSERGFKGRGGRGESEGAGGFIEEMEQSLAGSKDLLSALKESRAALQQSLTTHVTEAFQRIGEVIAHEKEICRDTEASMTRMLEDLRLQARNDIAASRACREEIEEQILQLLEDACVKVESSVLSNVNHPNTSNANNFTASASGGGGISPSSS